MNISRFLRRGISAQHKQEAVYRDDEHSQLSIAPRPFTVALTGSTGNLGSYVLDELLKSSQVSKIICLNRSADAKTRQVAAHESRGLTTHLPPERVEFLQVDLAAEDLGIDSAEYRRLTEEISLVIHSAWPVDFNRKLSSFTPSLEGITVLINLLRTRSPAGRRPIGLLFVSSVGAASNWASYATTSRDKIPEEELTEWKLARTGYGQSKLLSERVLAQATRTWNLPVAIVRVGQLAGPVEHGLKGAWPPQEWVPSLIRSSVALGAVPGELGPNDAVDWIPVDVAARVLGELAMDLGERVALRATAEAEGGEEEEARFYHVSNPHVVQWSEMVPIIRKHLPGEVRTVGFIEWTDLLKEAMDVAEAEGYRNTDDDAMPAVKLWDTYHFMQDRAIRFPGSQVVTLDTKRTVKRSHTLANLQPVSPQWMELWMKQWQFSKVSK